MTAQRAASFGRDCMVRAILVVSCRHQQNAVPSAVAKRQNLLPAVHTLHVEDDIFESPADDQCPAPLHASRLLSGPAAKAHRDLMILSAGGLLPHAPPAAMLPHCTRSTLRVLECECSTMLHLGVETTETAACFAYSCSRSSP